ncbi:MAG: 4-hydroxy-3-methylbut-2-enyl diphosphate reductase [Deltaproteobacteria bacterium]|nr:4-hydroxy-3-methylbut-2-enyl diphosphate reductase [Candidatus Anaeroferrophillacea bacterium]
MEIELAASAGFCFGVKRAVNLAVRAAAEHPGKPIFTLGPIIHNPQVVADLERRGIHRADDPVKILAGVVIIRSHGITRQTLEALETRPEITIIDATCPFVRRAQEIVGQMAAEGYRVIIVGEDNHPEVVGLLSYGGPNRTLAVSSADDLPAELTERGNRRGGDNVALLAQTTQSFDTFRAVANRLLPHKGETRCFNTICDATSQRQNESLAIAGRSDCMIVIGGYASANTTRLEELCRGVLPNTHHIETAADLDPSWYAGARRIGVTAGASTPGWLIEAVMVTLQTGGNSKGKSG